jgi:hypothetical protein
MSKDRKNCMCTAMLYDPKEHVTPEETKEDFKQNSHVYERFMEVKQSRFLKKFKKGGGGTLSKMILKYFFNF